MYRFLLTPRWWGINLFVLVSVPFCIFMGSWQLDRFAARVETHEASERNKGVFPTDHAASSLDDLLVTKQTTGRLAVATGHYDAQFLVPDRWLDDERGFYVVTLLRPERGGAVPVVRGWLPGDAHSAHIPAPPRGRVTVTGAVQPPETRGTKGAHEEGGLPAGRLGVLNAGSLVNLVPYQVHDVWLTLRDAPGELRPVPPAGPPGTGLDLKAFQNLGYTGEWFVFAGFVVFMWFRFYRREAELHRAQHSDAPVETPRRTPAAAVAMVHHDPFTDARKDRTLKIAGAISGAGLLALITWIGTAYIAGQDVQSRLVTFDVVSGEEVEARIEVERASSGSTVVCTLRSLAETGQEVGRKDVRIKETGRRVEARVTLRTAQRATAVELVGCR